MKRLLGISILGMLVIALFALNLPLTDDVLAQGEPTAAPRATRVRQPKTTPVPQPTATPEPEQADAEADAELVPVAPGAMTSQIIIFNPDTTGTATVQIDIYDGSGAVAYTTTESVSANGAKVISLPGSLGSNFQGGAVISSDKNVQALALAANGNNTARDAYEGTGTPATDLIFPFARHLANETQNTIIAIQNTSASSADVTITFYNADDGQPAHQENVSIPAHKSLYRNTNDIFPGSTFTGSIAVHSPQEIVAALQTRYFKDTAAVRALTLQEQDTLVYLNPVQRAINAKGVPQNWSEIFARNGGASLADITVEFFNTAGTSLFTQTAHDIPANGTAKFLLNEAAFDALGSNFAGWAKVTSDAPLGVSAMNVFSKAKRFTGADGLPNAELNTRYVCGNTARAATEKTQLTLVNTEARNAKVVVRLFDPNTGARLVQTVVKLAPNAAAVMNFSDSVFAAAGSDFHGITLVQARGTTPSKIMASVSNPYGSSKLSGTTGYLCTAIH